MADVRRVALVTGCSSGIGEATARLLAERGYRVYATGHTLGGVERLRGAHRDLEVLELDATSEVSIRSAVARVLGAAGRIDVVVNNAGYAIVGAVEDLDRDTLRRQFEVNVFGAMSLCRAVLPAMRRQGGGWIVNVSSVAGRVSVPALGLYCASKFALEAFSDALRLEARPFGVRVVVVEPGSTRTKFQDRLKRESRAVLENEGSAYASVYREAFENYTSTVFGASPEDVARRIAKVLGKRRPAARYRVKWWDTLAIAFAAVVPRRLMDAFIARWIGLEGLRGARVSPGILRRGTDSGTLK